MNNNKFNKCRFYGKNMEIRENNNKYMKNMQKCGKMSKYQKHANILKYGNIHKMRKQNKIKNTKY